ncbi:hypothetical protein MKW92_034538, partial [Papaver armeniacum]
MEMVHHEKFEEVDGGCVSDKDLEAMIVKFGGGWRERVFKFGADDQTKGIQLLEVYAIEIQLYTGTKNNKKLK